MDDLRLKETKNGMAKPGKKGLARLIAATGHSMSGFREAWRNEEAFRMEASLALAFVPLAFLVGESLVHRLLLLIVCALVILAELVNTAIETIVDRISAERHPLSGQAKDLGSAIVFVTLMLFLATWVPSLWHWWQGL